VIEKGGTAEAALDAVDGTIDGLADRDNFLVADWCSEGEMDG